MAQLFELNVRTRPKIVPIPINANKKYMMYKNHILNVTPFIQNPLSIVAPN
ncbi:hypothetical protein OXB_0788 [Bacillus sp. OxB-1]|nr:hypothetical protein OXB_0788 [Bacillus sp. OxB-1]